ncbi:GNAT family N-acetyltransferase [Saccharothrix sp. Mg75]|uniref:GNAT family N-acetyltransferase n=1 Tax=Saccharothrix sp. Mg75 TaxID=3445357 RepID=UPI003EE918E6
MTRPAAGELGTARLVLRPPVPGDAAAVHAVHRDPRACEHNPSDALRTPEEAVALPERWLAHWRGFGFCGLRPTRLDDRRAWR